MSIQDPKNALLEWRELLLLAAVAGMALLLRLLVANTPTCISGDGVSYVNIAKQITLGGDWFHPIFPPGYSLLIAAAHIFFGASFELAGRYIAAVSGALVIIPAWFIWRSAYGAVAAGFSCLLLAMWPLSVELGGHVYTGPTSLLGLFAGLYAWLRARRGEHWLWGLAAGLFWGAVAWMKPEVLAWGLLGCVMLLWRRYYRAGGLLLAGTVLIYLPNILLLHEHTGRWQIAAKQDANILKAQAIGQQDFTRAYEEVREAAAQGANALTPAHPVQLIKRGLINLYSIHRYAISQSWPPILLALVAIGFFLAWRQHLLEGWLWLPVLATVPLLIFIVDARILHPFFAVMMGVSGLAIAEFAGLRRWAVVGLCVFFLLPHALRPLYRPHPDEAARQAGLWLANHAEKNVVVLDRKPFVAYYADLPLIWPPKQAGLAGLKKSLSVYESVVLVVDNRYFRNSRPKWFEAIACTPPWLREMAQFDGRDGHRVRLLSYRQEQ